MYYGQIESKSVITREALWPASASPEGGVSARGTLQFRVFFL